MDVDAKSFGMAEDEFARWQALPLQVREYLTNAHSAGPFNYIDSWGRIDLWKLVPDRAEQERIGREMERAGSIISALVRGVGLRFGLGPDNARYVARCVHDEILAGWKDEP